MSKGAQQHAAPGANAGANAAEPRLELACRLSVTGEMVCKNEQWHGH